MAKAQVKDNVIDQVRRVKAIKLIYNGEIRVIQKGTKLLLTNCKELDDNKLNEIIGLWDGDVRIVAKRNKDTK